MHKRSTQGQVVEMLTTATMQAANSNYASREMANYANPPQVMHGTLAFPTHGQVKRRLYTKPSQLFRCIDQGGQNWRQSTINDSAQVSFLGRRSIDAKKVHCFTWSIKLVPHPFLVALHKIQEEAVMHDSTHTHTLLSCRSVPHTHFYCMDGDSATNQRQINLRVTK